MIEEIIDAPSWIRLVSGEMLFCEVFNEKDGVIFVKNPHIVNYIQAGNFVNIVLSDWVPVSDQPLYPIVATNILSMGPLNKESKTHFGSVVLNKLIDNIKKEIFEVVKQTPILPSKWLNSKFEEMFALIINHSIVYNLVPPLAEELKENFYSFIIKLNEPESEERN